jgi:hypothetical protein
MPSYSELKRRSLLPLVGLGLGLYYLLVFAPLAQRAENLDEPLEKSWRKLAATLEKTNATTLDFCEITNQLGETRQCLAILKSTKAQAVARLELAPALRAKLNAPFQLVDYENERGKQMDELARQAKEQQIAVDPAVFSGFPEHTADMQEPALLWAALAFTDELLDSAVRCKVGAIHSLEVPLALTNFPSAEGPGGWTEIPVQVEFTASAANAARLAQSLPLRPDELRAAGLPEAPSGKVPLLIDRLIIKKQSPDKLDEVRVWLRAVGYVLRQ